MEHLRKMYWESTLICRLDRTRSVCFSEAFILVWLTWLSWKNGDPSRNPIPPIDLGIQSSDQLNQCTFLSCIFWPHQNLLIIPSRSLSKPFGSKKHLMAYVGIACATTLSKISLLAWYIIFSFHPFSLLQTLSMIGAKTVFLLCPTIPGSPKYFSYSVTALHPMPV